jgi:hypothetical protein
MALQTIPGFTGFAATRVSSMDKRAIGKFTASNHMDSLHQTDPADYDKKIISLYTQTQLYSNDFQQMLDKSTPYYIDSNAESFKWDINVPYEFPKVIEIPEETALIEKPGIDHQEFSLVFDKNEWVLNDVITSQKMELATPLTVVKDPVPYNSGWLYTFTILSENPKVDFIHSKFFQVGVEFEFLFNLVGEFTTDLSGLPTMGSKITLFESLGAGFGVEHSITDWADARMLRDGRGNPLDLMVYGNIKRGALPETMSADIRWEPYVEYLMRKKMYDMKTSYMIWGRPGTAKDRNSKQEIKKASSGIYHKMINNGNTVYYNRGEFNIQLLRDVFGDLFYRRVDIKDRKVKIYTNEAGFEIFKKANKEDLLNSGLTVIADNRFIQGSGQNMTVSYAFDSVITSDTGRIDLVHLRQLDLPNTNLEQGQNKKSTPIFMVFDVSPTGDGSLQNNIRQVRMKSRPSMTWGYVDGAIHHLGFAKSQGMSSNSKDPWYTIWMKDRCDVFIEDLSRCVIIKEVPSF